MNFLAYVRRSTDKQEQSLAGQREACMRHATTLGGEIKSGDFFEDDAISGSDMTRPGLGALLKACRSRKNVQGVIVWDRSRLARADDPRAAMLLEYEIEATGKKLHFVNTAAPAGGGIASHIVALVESDSAGKYLVDLSRNVMRGLVQTVNAGFLDGRIPAFGYDSLYVDPSGKPLFIVRYNHDRSKEVYEAVSENGRAVAGRHIRSLQPAERPPRSRTDKPTLILGDPVRQQIVREMYDWAVHERIGFKRIAQRLNARNVKAPMGGRWSIASVHETLTNPVYRGALRWNYRRRGKFQRLSKDGIVSVTDRGSFKLLRNAPEDIIVRENAVPALIAPELWFRAQEIRASRQTQSYRGKAARASYLVSGLAYCGNGHRLQGVSAESKGYRYHRYRCSERHLGGETACDAQNIQREKVDSYVLGWVQEHCLAPMLNSKEVWEEFERQFNQPIGTKERLAAEDRIRKIESTINRLVDAIDDANLAMLNGKLTKLREERAELQAFLATHTSATVEMNDFRERAKIYIKRAQEVLAEGTPEEQRELVRDFVDRVEIDTNKNEGRLRYRAPFSVISEKLCIQKKRVKGFEPSTSTLARSRSTTELHPR
jgi:DNA invertase Pin-like site-specific DNA recombinase